MYSLYSSEGSLFIVLNGELTSHLKHFVNGAVCKLIGYRLKVLEVVRKG